VRQEVNEPGYCRADQEWVSVGEMVHNDQCAASARNVFRPDHGDAIEQMDDQPGGKPNRDVGDCKEYTEGSDQ